MAYEQGMKKYFAALAAALVLLAGCNDPSRVTSTVFNEPWSGEEQSVPEISDGSDSSGGSGSSSSSSDLKLSKDELDKAAENVWLFGKKISLPCRFEKFGEDFSLGEEFFYQVENDLIAFLLYKGEVIGEVILENCTEEDPNKSAKKVVQIALGDAMNNPVSIEGWYSGEIYFDVLGITMKSEADDVKALLGEPTRKNTSGKHYYKISDEKFIEITYNGNKIVEFVIESR